MLLCVTMRDHFERHSGWRHLDLRCDSIVIFLLAAAVAAGGQTPDKAAVQESSATDKPVVITLDDAIRRAQASEPAYAAATAASRSSALDRTITRAGLLPNVAWYNQGLYTQPNGAHGQVGQFSDTADLPKFIANNGVREYFSQVIVNETLGWGR